MKNDFLIVSLLMGLTLFLDAEVKLLVSDYGTGEVKNISLSTDDNGNKNYIYIDKGSQIIDSTIGSTVVRNHHFTKEEGMKHYEQKIERYQNKLESYHHKIDEYYEKIAQKPKRREHYQNKIERYQDKITQYKQKILEAEKKLKKYQEMR